MLTINTALPKNEILDQLKDLGIDKDIPELMDFSFLAGEEWERIVMYFRVALMVYYRNRYTREEVKEIGLGDGAVSTMRKQAREYEISENVHPYLAKYVRRFQHLGYRNALQKIKRDFLFYAWRTSQYSNPNVLKKYNLANPTLRRYLGEAKSGT